MWYASLLLTIYNANACDRMLVISGTSLLASHILCRRRTQTQMAQNFFWYVQEFRIPYFTC